MTKEKGDKILFYTIIIIVLAIAALLLIPKFFTKEQLTLDQLHKLNLDGKLSPDKGYIYKGKYSFVYFDKLWYGLIPATPIKKVFSIPFHYGPREVEDIIPKGNLNLSNLNAYKNFFMTFDPLDSELNFIAASTSEADAVFVQAFGKGVIGSCSRNETAGCVGRPIVECNSTDAPVFYFASEEETNVIYLNNCAILAGSGREIFRATDRMLFDLLGIMQ